MFKSFSDDNAKHYILLVLGIMSCFTYIVYGKAYSQRISVSRRQCRGSGAEVLKLRPSALLSADWHPLAISLTIHNICETWHYPQNRKYVMFCIVIREGLEHLQKILWSLDMYFLRHVVVDKHAGHNTSHATWWRSKRKHVNNTKKQGSY